MIEFGRGVCGDLASAERREWLVTNGLGGFASGTIAGTLTRRYHGLLIAAFRPPVERMLLVAKIDEVATYRGRRAELNANRWRDDYVSPNGYTLIERFRLDGSLPVWEYAIADALLEKRVWMEPGANRTYVQYRVLRAASPIDLSLRIFVNYRDFHGNTHAGDWHIGITSEDPRRLRVDAVADGRPFWIAADGGAIAVENVWYRDFVLAQETMRGLDDRDDNLAAGSASVTLEPGASIAIACSDEAIETVDVVAAMERRAAHDAAVTAAYPRTAPFSGGGSARNDEQPARLVQCALAADQFVVAHPIDTDPGARSIIAGYHWFGDWGRDTMIALPGLTLTTGRPEIARSILTTFSAFVDGGMLPNFFPEHGQAPEYNTVDAALWYAETAARYVE
ncbi:MAG: glycogen debranching enzyme N-terminal domain-containing protein, partial [Candidatus Tumulicola sp.]